MLTFIEPVCIKFSLISNDFFDISHARLLKKKYSESKETDTLT